MRFWLGLVIVFFLVSCEDILDITRIDGPCTIQLKDGSTVFTEDSIEILESTGAITYRDADDKLWSITRDEYESYSCGN
ncbi:MAG: hypothetical protein B7Z16_07645 [Algoriphagus sp. 32-45-6]|nr:MAG: hypothetical protein B7Z16_07645 [Algoriphagus sp. 32-45-6]